MLTNVVLWHLVVIFMPFPTCRNLVLSANLFKKYPYWADYLTDPHAVQLKRYLTNPIEVLPGRKLHEAYGKYLMSLIELSNVDTFLTTNSIWYGTTRHKHIIYDSRYAVISRDLISHFEYCLEFKNVFAIAKI